MQYRNKKTHDINYVDHMELVNVFGGYPARANIPVVVNNANNFDNIIPLSNLKPSDPAMYHCDISGNVSIFGSQLNSTDIRYPISAHGGSTGSCISNPYYKAIFTPNTSSVIARGAAVDIIDEGGMGEDGIHDLAEGLTFNSNLF